MFSLVMVIPKSRSAQKLEQLYFTVIHFVFTATLKKSTYWKFQGQLIFIG